MYTQLATSTTTISSNYDESIRVYDSPKPSSNFYGGGCSATFYNWHIETHCCNQMVW